METEGINTQNEFGHRKVFISYSWSSKLWVLDFASKLQRDYGIEVVIDTWDLKPGDDLAAFMEREVSDSTIDKVLMICDKQYMEKANTRSGGAGTEAQILSPQLYSKNTPGKYIPVVNMLDEKQQPYLPVFLTSRLYVDFSDPTKEDTSFDSLINTIYDQTTITKPKLGPIPVKILNHEANNYSLIQTGIKVKSSIESPRLMANIFQNDFLEYMQEALENNKVEKKVSTNDEMYEEVIKKIKEFDDNESLFKDCVRLYLRSGESNGASLSEYFSNVNEKIHRIDDNDREYDSIRFILTEQFLIVVGELIKQRQWNILKYLSLYNYKIGNRRKADFTFLRNPPASIYDYNDKHKRKLSPIGNMIKERNETIFNQIWCADIFLFYISKLRNKNSSNYFYWYPIIQTRTSYPSLPDFPFLENLNIEENMNVFLNIAGVTEEKLKSSEVYQKYTQFDNFTGVPPIKEFQKNWF
ncbi:MULTISPECIES: toll/interleukin-1 receptor domain-containing protein [Liquorilactobacillus]|uniref:toll/interleukin-1 receptor domain-containing protein n=1 Tax=Liquorilactobacillus TaxID=2767888 RepID=UPI0021C2933B|nr:TIR domain-containing protein [Liquorilactobacillus satsumensis]MCP9328691.1 TIR domain-containing protein [Liquorilactobacillus satsumensis]